MNSKNHITRPLFLLALGLLILNDFVLKGYFHNALTGKLSDFAGLFAFSYFLSVFFKNKKNIKWVYSLVGLFFVFWKSAYSAGFIHLINQSPLHIGRVVDYTDLWALLTLPASYFYRISERRSFKIWHPSLKYGIVLMSCFAFVATSSLPKTTKLNLKSGKTYQTSIPKDSVVKKLKLHQVKDSLYSTFLSVEKRNSTVDLNVVLAKREKERTRIKLDSILSFTNQDNSVLSILNTSKRDIKKMKTLEVKDYEKLFEEKKIELLKSKPHAK